jgi:hypothetical protein
MTADPADPGDSRRPFAHETLAVTTGAAVALTNAVYNPSSGASSLVEISCETNDVRYWQDGTNPTSSQGKYLAAGDVLEIDGGYLIANLKFIAVSASATLQVEYWR